MESLIGLVTVICTAIVWLIRLEAKVSSVTDKIKSQEENHLLRMELVKLQIDRTDKAYDELSRKHEALAEKVSSQLNLILTHLGNIEGRLTNNEEQQN